MCINGYLEIVNNSFYQKQQSGRKRHMVARIKLSWWKTGNPRMWSPELRNDCFPFPQWFGPVYAKKTIENPSFSKLLVDGRDPRNCGEVFTVSSAITRVSLTRNSNSKIIFIGEGDVFGQKPDTMILCPPQIPSGLAMNQTRASRDKRPATSPFSRGMNLGQWSFTPRPKIM
jgi:hypothetical protein